LVRRDADAGSPQWRDVYRPVLGAVAVARGDGLSRGQIAGITGLPEERTDDALRLCRQYLVGGDGDDPYRIYHQSFRDFLLNDKHFTVYPAERHAAIARYLQEKCGANWGTCDDVYALQYAPVHWAEAATSSEHQRDTRTKALIELTANAKYQRRFERTVGDIPALQEHMRRAARVAALTDRDDMLPWLTKAAQSYVAFRRDYLQAEAIVTLARDGKLDQAEARLRLFTDLDEDWQVAARAIIALTGSGRNPEAAARLRSRILATTAANAQLRPLFDWLAGPASVSVPEPGQTSSLEIAQELVKRISGQPFNTELLHSANPSLIAVMPSGPPAGPELEAIARCGYAAALDAPILVDVARTFGTEGSELVDRYIDAHAGYTYVEYRNRSLWFVLQAVLSRHPEPAWVKERLGRILVAALTGGGVEFRETLPLTAKVLRDRAIEADARLTLENWRAAAIRELDKQPNDSWGSHKRRLTALMEHYVLLFDDARAADETLVRLEALPGGFAGFQAPAFLRLADALRACGLDTRDRLSRTIEEARRSAHHIQDYHFCARITARCNTLKRWHAMELNGTELAAVIRRLGASADAAEFAADHFVHEPYHYRDDNPADVLPIASARQAQTLEQLVEVFQRPAVEFRRLNPQYGLTQVLASQTCVRVPDPGLAPLLAVHFGARALSERSLDEGRERGALLRALVPVAAINPTALDTLLSYVLIATEPDDPDLLEDVIREAGPIAFRDVAPAAAQIGPHAVVPN
jgi:hypothetical protein